MSLPFSLGWGAGEGGVVDKDGLGTGFTMIQPSTTGGYLAANLDVNTTAPGTLDITTTNGIQFKTPATTERQSERPEQWSRRGLQWDGRTRPPRDDDRQPASGFHRFRTGRPVVRHERGQLREARACSDLRTQMRVQLLRERDGI